MKGKKFKDHIEIYIQPQEIIFAPASQRKPDGKLEKLGISIGSMINWFAWKWMNWKYPKVLDGYDISSMKLEWDGEKFIATFMNDPIPK